MEILVVGAGAVGQVYALCLVRGGAKVSFHVRPRHVEELRKGTTLYPLKSRDRRDGVSLRVDAVLTEIDEVRAKRWDAVFLCVPSTAIDDDFVGPLVSAAGGAVIVALSPGIESLACVVKHAGDERVVPGLIGMIAYEAPLPGETVATPGIAFYLPPMSPSAFGGARAAEIVEALQKGECPAVVQRDVASAQAFGTSVLMPAIVALEAAGWSLGALRRGEMVEVAARAAQEAIRVVARSLAVPPPFFRFFVRAWVLRLVLLVAPRLVPLDLEVYLAHHFGKVRPQTRELLLGYLDGARKHAIDAPALTELAAVITRSPE